MARTATIYFDIGCGFIFYKLPNFTLLIIASRANKICSCSSLEKLAISLRRLSIVESLS